MTTHPTAKPIITLQGVSELLTEMARSPMGWRVERIAFAGHNAKDEPVYRIVVVHEDTAIEHYITSYIPWTILARHWAEHDGEV